MSKGVAMVSEDRRDVGILVAEGKDPADGEMSKRSASWWGIVEGDRAKVRVMLGSGPGGEVKASMDVGYREEGRRRRAGNPCQSPELGWWQD